MIRATGSLRLLHGSSGVVPSMKEQRLVNDIITALRKERALDRETLDEDDCIVHPRSGDEPLFEDLKDFTAYLKGYVIIPVEEYSRLGGSGRI